MKDCNHRNYFKKTRIAVYFLTLLLKVFRASFFNVVIFIIGFCCGFLYLSSTVHYNAYKNSNYNSLIKIKEYLGYQREIDNFINQEIKKLEHKMSHDEYKACESFPVKYLK